MTHPFKAAYGRPGCAVSRKKEFMAVREAQALPKKDRPREQKTGVQVRFWGVRGSTPTPQPENLRYGGNTSCVEVRVNGHIYIFDCGTGFRILGKELAREFEGKPLEAHVFLSHFHWDHIQGIPFFLPLYNSRANQFHFHSSSRTRRLQHALEDQMSDPYFPVDMSAMQAKRHFCDIDEDTIEFDHCKVQSRRLNHPQGCLGFRLETKDKIIVYATDNEPGHEGFDKNVRALAEGADLLIYDAQYLPEEYEAQKRGWGHSHWREAVNISMESGAKELILFHHDPDHTDACIDSIVEDARSYYPKVRGASEGLEIKL